MRRTAVSDGERLWSEWTSGVFVISAGMVLGVTGAAKVWAAFGGAKALAMVDPIFGIRFKTMMLMAGTLEMAVALVCIVARRRTALNWVAWLATLIAVYRLGLWHMNWQLPCHCLGNLTESLHIPAEIADNLMKGVLAYLLAGSYGSLWWLWRGKPGRDRAHVPAPTTATGAAP